MPNRESASENKLLDWYTNINTSEIAEKLLHAKTRRRLCYPILFKQCKLAMPLQMLWRKSLDPL